MSSLVRSGIQSSELSEDSLHSQSSSDSLSGPDIRRVAHSSGVLPFNAGRRRLPPSVRSRSRSALSSPRTMRSTTVSNVADPVFNQLEEGSVSQNQAETHAKNISGLSEQAHDKRSSQTRFHNVHHSLSSAPPSSFRARRNPDPGTQGPGFEHARLHSTRRTPSFDGLSSIHYPSNDSPDLSSDQGPMVSDDEEILARPRAPFMNRPNSTSLPPTSIISTPPNSRPNSFHNNGVTGSAKLLPSISGSIVVSDEGSMSSPPSMRAPFLSPASRPSSTILWQPPSYILSSQTDEIDSPREPGDGSNTGQSVIPYGTIPKRTPLRSTLLLEPIGKEAKPWLQRPDSRSQLSWWITFLCILAGCGGAAFVCYSGVRSIRQLSPSELCLVLDDDFRGNELDSSSWSRVNQLGGFGNGEFEMTTTDSAFLSNGQLYMYPTLTADDGVDVFHDRYTLEGCTAGQANSSACSITPFGNSIVHPVKSARIHTKGKVNITYGKVEVKAKLPTGDWLWPAIWMLPDGYDDDNGLGQGAYGIWPLSGEIDIMEARGNRPDYAFQGNNFVRSSLNHGPFPTLATRLYGWFSLKRGSFASEFHTYAMEWDSDFMRFYADSKLHSMLSLRTRNYKESFWNRADYPETYENGTSKVGIRNPWSPYSDNPNAPYDRPFYLIINLSVGGISGWFPDDAGHKPWYDESPSAMFDFAFAQDKWYSTWPSHQDDRSFRIDYVKMWQKC